MNTTYLTTYIKELEQVNEALRRRNTELLRVLKDILDADVSSAYAQARAQAAIKDHDNHHHSCHENRSTSSQSRSLGM